MSDRLYESATASWSRTLVRSVYGPTSSWYVPSVSSMGPRAERGHVDQAHAVEHENTTYDPIDRGTKDAGAGDDGARLVDDVVAAAPCEGTSLEGAACEAFAVEQDGDVGEVVGNGFHPANVNDLGAGSSGASLPPTGPGEDPEKGPLP